jgi:hypothetical protein
MLDDELRQLAVDRVVGDVKNAGRRSWVNRLTSGIVGLNGAPGNGPKPVTRMRRDEVIVALPFRHGCLAQGRA